MDAIIDEWRQTILTAGAQRQPLRLVGGGSKDFFGQPAAGTPLSTRRYRGVTAYEPSELFITARCGTPLAEIESILADKNQMLAFEPPHFGDDATIGGCVAAGLSGPRRASAGAVRDFVLGARLLDGNGRSLRFGGQVMKNVAGYDVSRLLAGSMGTLGLITEVTLKVSPKPMTETSVAFDAPQADALALMNRWSGLPLPISAHCWQDNRLTVRLSGAAAAVDSARRTIGGREIEEGDTYWRMLREQRTDFFLAAPQTKSLWRLSVPSTTLELAHVGQQLIEWGGALRWLWSAVGPHEIRSMVAQAGGHATLFRADASTKRDTGVFHPLQPPLAVIHRNLKHAFDPGGVLNPGRLYPDF